MTDRRSFLKLLSGGAALPLVVGLPGMALARAPGEPVAFHSFVKPAPPAALVFEPYIRAVMADDVPEHVWRTHPEDWALHFRAEGPTIEHILPLIFEATQSCIVAELWMDVGPWSRRFYTWKTRHLIACDSLHVSPLTLTLQA